MPYLASWRARLAIELGALATFLLVLNAQGAPAWALTLAVAVFTRAAMLDTRADLARVQNTATRTKFTVEQSVLWRRESGQSPDIDFGVPPQQN